MAAAVLTLFATLAAPASAAPASNSTVLPAGKNPKSIAILPILLLFFIPISLASVGRR